MTDESLNRKIEDAEDTAQRLHGMLTSKSTEDEGQPDEALRLIPLYGDLTSLNTSRLIHDSVGSSLLSDLVEDLMCLLDTSCAVFEKNGDYALRIISSDWCRFLDQASRRLCEAADNREAMESGRWRCHESCWNRAARRAIETKGPVDVACCGGIRLLAVPIRAGEEVVGSISIGYGEPPCDAEKLGELAATYGLSVEELRRQAEAYEPRSPFILQLARKRLLFTARYIGEIVARKQVERALRRSEERFHAVFNFAKDAIYILDQEGRLLDANRIACETLGYSRDELLNMNPLEIDMSSRAEYDERMETLQRKGYVRFETLNRKRDGTFIPMEVSLQFLDLAGSRVILAVCRDISERKRAEEALLLMQFAMDRAPDSILLVGDEGHLEYANEAACASMGYTREELLNMKVFDIDPDFPVEGWEQHKKDLKLLGKMTLQGRHRKKDGELFPVEVTTNYLDYKGSFLGVAFDRDITERKRSEENLAHSYNLMRYIIEHTNSAVAVFDRDLRYIYVSRRYLDDYRLQDRDIIGKHHYDVFPDLPRPIRDVHQRVLAGEVSRADSDPYYRADGTLDWIRWECRPWYEADGGIGGVILYSEIITDRILAEEALEKRIVALTRPLDEIGSITVEDLFNLADLQRLQDLLSETWGVAGLITRPDGSPVTKPSNFTSFCSEFIRGTEKGRRKCKVSDAAMGRHDPAGPIIQTCLSAGLCGAGASITVGGRHLANWLIGQVRNETQSEEKIMQYCHELGLDETTFREAYLKVPFMPQEKFEQIAHALFALANQLSNTAYQNIQQARFIAERRQAEEALRESERKLKEAQRIARLGSWELDLATKALQWSDGFYELFELDPRKVAPSYEAFLDVAHPDDQRMVRRAYAESLKNRTPYEISHRLLMKDGRIKWIHGIGHTEYDRMGNPVKSIGTVQDITELKQAEEALRESEERFRLVVESSPLAIGFADEDARIEYVNPKFSEMFGYVLEDIPTLADWYRCAFPGPEYRESTVERLEKLLDMPGNWFGSARGMEVEVTCKGGSVRNIEFFRTRMGNKTLAVLNDLTERRQIEEERRKFDLQMREVQKLESLGVLAGGIAHDFNNLLMAVLGYADLALLSLSPVSPACQYIEEISRASQRAADLCRQMLAYSGKGRFVISRYNLSEVVREMGQMLDVSVSKKAVMRYSLAEGLPAVESDVTQIRQVIMNLITNAADALGDSMGVITIATGVRECDEAYLSESYLKENLPGGTYVYLEVSDTGCGMDDATRSRIFDPFFTTKFIGRGLGLAAVLGIVRGHRGAIKVYSEVGKGTTFKILLPAVEWESGEKTKTGEQSESLQGGGTILLIDDDPFVRSVASEMLTKLGFQVLTADNGLEGIKMFQAHQAEITCVLLDLMMPEMGGEEAFRELRNMRKDIPVILSSGYNEQEVTQRFVGRGLTGFIQKPYTVANLGRALKKALG